MIGRTSAVAFFGMLLASTGVAAECDITLKPTDTYRELSAKLKCLTDEIQALKSTRPERGGSVSIAPPQIPGDRLIKLSSGCLVIPTTLNLVEERVGPGASFCTIDGQVASRIYKITDDRIFIKNTAGADWNCRMGAKCSFDWNSRAEFRIKNILFAGEGKLFAEMEFKPR